MDEFYIFIRRSLEGKTIERKFKNFPAIPSFIYTSGKLNSTPLI